MTTPTITQLEMSEADIDFAEKIAKSLGFTQTAYTSTSQLWGLFCLPDHAKHKHGCIIKTAELGFLFVSDLEDLQLHRLAELERMPETQEEQSEREHNEAASELRLGTYGEDKKPLPQKPYQPKTGQACSCRPGQERDNCPQCEGTGQRIDFKAIRERNAR